ncbi:TetR/AcrR family transcriptional regulator [Pseudomonas sp. Irchel 3E20]|uniref:TetR/AcrR family transcriptional regulator n=1 Tax=Pseudomonas sp. Irchel 3E20 TaxID=2008983 RepID=UPI000BA39365|nr:TetR/AcrR family transcriptional regulator [Pseudomonas sp. Irchel 3E20]
MTTTSELSAVAQATDVQPRKPRKNNPEKTRENILQEAIVEFVQQGLSGARVDAIAERIHTSKRMIYYYFGSKEQLYIEVLEKVYGDIRNTEGALNLSQLGPLEAIRRLVEFTFDHHDHHTDFVRIVSVENIHHAEYVKQSDAIKAMNHSMLTALGEVLARGVEQGVFRAGLTALDVHLLINSFCFFRVSNRYTVGEIFQLDLAAEAIKQRHREMICESVSRYLLA